MHGNFTALDDLDGIDLMVFEDKELEVTDLLEKAKSRLLCRHRQIKLLRVAFFLDSS